MNSISANLDRFSFQTDHSFLNFQVDGLFLHEKLSPYSPYPLVDLMPTLHYCLEPESARSLVWNRILPEKGTDTVCPLLMCPDDTDFYCSLLDVHITNTGTTIQWINFGFDLAQIDPEKSIGTNVEWFPNAARLEFPLREYQAMLNRFREEYLRSEIAAGPPEHSLWRKALNSFLHGPKN